jgi:hypothetical protein
MKPLIARHSYLIGILLCLLVAASLSRPEAAPEVSAARPSAFQGSGVLLAASDVFVNGNPAPPGTTLLSGSVVSAGPSGRAVLLLGPHRRVNLGAGSGVTLVLSPEHARLKVACGRFLLTVARGRIEVRSPDARTLEAGAAEIFNQTIEAEIIEGADIIIECGERISAIDNTPIAGARADSARIGVIELIRIALVIAEDIATGGQHFVKTPPQAADPVTP